MRIRVGDHERAERSNSPLVAHERERVSARSYARNARLARNNARFRSARCQPWAAKGSAHVVRLLDLSFSMAWGSLDPAASSRGKSVADCTERCRRSSTVPTQELQQNNNSELKTSETSGGGDILSAAQSWKTHNISQISATDESIEPPFCIFVESTNISP